MGRVIELHFVLQGLHLKGEPRVAASLPGCLPRCRGGMGALEKIACIGDGPDHVLEDLSRTAACAALHRGPRGAAAGARRAATGASRGITGPNIEGCTSAAVLPCVVRARSAGASLNWPLPGVDHPGLRAPWALEQGLLQAFPAACSGFRRHGRLRKNCTRRANSAHV
jgi:hypothetical protein